MPSRIETELIISSVFDSYFHVTNSDEMVVISRNSEVICDVISALQSEYCGHTYNQYNEHCDRDTTWYDYVDINSINIHSHYEPLSATEETLNNVEVTILPDDQTQKKDNISPLNKLADLNKCQMRNIPRVQMDGSAKFTVTNNLHLLKDIKWYNCWFRSKVTMKGATLDNIIIPEAQEFLQVPTITKV